MCRMHCFTAFKKEKPSAGRRERPQQLRRLRAEDPGMKSFWKPQHRARQPAGRNQPLADSRVDGEELRTGCVCGEGPEPPAGLAPGPSPAPRRFPAGAAEGTGSPAARRARAALPHIWKCALVKYWRRICEMRWHPREHARTARIPLSHYF